MTTNHIVMVQTALNWGNLNHDSLYNHKEENKCQK